LEVKTRRWDLSPTIFAFLKTHLGSDAVFHGDFDIPLQIVDEDTSLQERFLKQRIVDEEEDSEWSTEDSDSSPQTGGP